MNITEIQDKALHLKECKEADWKTNFLEVLIAAAEYYNLYLDFDRATGVKLPVSHLLECKETDLNYYTAKVLEQLAIITEAERWDWGVVKVRFTSGEVLNLSGKLFVDNDTGGINWAEYTGIQSVDFKEFTPLHPTNIRINNLVADKLIGININKSDHLYLFKNVLPEFTTNINDTILNVCKIGTVKFNTERFEPRYINHLECDVLDLRKTTVYGLELNIEATGKTIFGDIDTNTLTLSPGVYEFTKKIKLDKASSAYASTYMLDGEYTIYGSKYMYPNNRLGSGTLTEDFTWNQPDIVNSLGVNKELTVPNLTVIAPTGTEKYTIGSNFALKTDTLRVIVHPEMVETASGIQNTTYRGKASIREFVVEGKAPLYKWIGWVYLLSKTESITIPELTVTDTNILSKVNAALGPELTNFDIKEGYTFNCIDGLDISKTDLTEGSLDRLFSNIVSVGSIIVSSKLYDRMNELTKNRILEAGGSFIVK